MAAGPVSAIEIKPKIRALRFGRFLYLFALALALTWLGGLWTRQAEVIVLATQITEAVPPIPALGALLLLILLNPLLRLIAPPLSLSRSEILFIYAFCTVAVAVPACGGLRFVLSLITYPIYYDRMSPEMRLDLVLPHIPAWLVPKEFALIRDLYLGRADGKVPWGEWLIPIGAWLLFFVLFWVALTGILGIFEKRWRHHERLVFPLLYLPLQITEPAPLEGLPRFWLDPLMWLGFLGAALYNGLNMLNAFFPNVPAPGKFYDLGEAFTEPPLDALRPLVFQYRPEIVGLGYLMSTEVAFSVWFFYLLFKVEALIGRLLGWQWPGYPFPQEQGLGAYLATAILLFYAARWFLWEWKDKLFRGDDGRDDPLRPREAALWLFWGSIGCIAFMVAAGMNGRLAVLYFTLTLLVALVYARIRGEVGAPIVWLFPYYQHKKVIIYTLGPERLMSPRWGGLKSMTAFALFTFLARGFFLSYTATQFENIRLGEQIGYSPRLWVRVSVVAVIVGVLMGFYIHLQPYYTQGAVNLREGGIWGHWIAVQEYRAVVSYYTTPEPPDVHRVVATLWGAGMVLLTGALRFAYPNSPFHPLGFAIAGAYGNLVWWPFFLVWVIKFFVLRYGGGRIYRRTVPLFLGFALGHYLVAGVVWGLWSTTGKGPFQRYAVWFG